MQEYLIKKNFKNSNNNDKNITFTELIEKVKCTQNTTEITIDFSNVRDKATGEYLKPLDYKVSIKNGQVILERKQGKYMELDSLYKNGLVNAYLKGSNFKIVETGEEGQLKIV